MSDNSSHKTTDHDKIKNWVTERGGKPSRVKGTENKGGGEGLLRVRFPGVGDDSNLEDISWDEFFDTFEESKLAMVYQDETQGGQESRFCKLVSR